jgi:hypothetical protein
MGRTLWIAAGAVAIALPAAGDVTPTGPFAEVAETGQRGAGLAASVTYGAIQTPLVDGAGTFLFATELDGETPLAGGRNGGIFLGHRGALQMVAHAGDAAPGAGGAVWSDVIGGALMLRAGGRIAFPAELLGPDAAHNGGVWAGTAGSLTLVAREGDPAPGTTVNYAAGNLDNFFQDTLQLAMNDSGTVALRAKLAGTGVTTANDTAIFSGTPGALALVVRLGLPAPGAGGATYANSGSETFSAPGITASGNLFFRGHLTGTGVTGLNADGLWYGAPGALSLVVRAGLAVSGPGIPAGSTLIGLGAERPVVNDAGQVMFDGPAFNGASFAGAVWLGLPGSLAPIATQGLAAPSDTLGASFSGLFLHHRLNASGQAVFRANLSSGGGDYGLYGWDGATLRRLARTGDQAPGMAAGETFSGLASEDVFLNAAGKVLFRDTTKPSFTQGIWVADVTTGDVQLVASTGVSPTVTGQAARLLIEADLFTPWKTAGSGPDGRASPLGDDGTIAFAGTFIDGHIAVLTKSAGGAVGPCTDLASCLAALQGTLPDAAVAPDGKSRKVAKQLAKYFNSANKFAIKAGTTTGRKQTKNYAAARKAVTKLLAVAASADAKARLAANLTDIQTTGNGSLSFIPQ